MYSVSEAYTNKITSDNRQFAVRISFVGLSTVLTGTTIQNITLDEVVNSTDALTLGCACSNKITVNLINAPTDIDYNNVSFRAEVGVKIEERPETYEWIPLGRFFVTEAETNNDFKNLTLTAYDGFSKMTLKYEAAVPESTTLQAVFNDLKVQILARCGVTLKPMSMPEYSLTFPYLDITYQQAIAYLAGCVGGFARFARDGELEIATYEDSAYTIPKGMQYLGGFKRTTKNSLIITSISTGTQDHTIVRGEGANGTTISFENPYITSEMADDVYDSVNNTSYTPCQLKWRGNPAIQAGDIVQVFDNNDAPHNVLIMRQTLKIGGGCNAQIECKGNGTTQAEFSNGFSSIGQKLERVYTTLEKAIIDATNAITGNSGGYVVLHDSNDDGKPDELLITDTEIIEDATKVWRWNKEGLGYAFNAAGNAYAGPYATAITADGQIVANFVTTGTLNAERIAVENFDANDPTKITDYIRFGDGTMTFGKGDSEITLKLENNQVAFYSGSTRIAYFSNNSFEIENLTEGKIRFQNFGFVPRTSGNLTFTKLV